MLALCFIHAISNAGISIDDAEKMVIKLRLNKQYKEDVWTWTLGQIEPEPVNLYSRDLKSFLTLWLVL